MLKMDRSIRMLMQVLWAQLLCGWVLVVRGSFLVLVRLVPFLFFFVLGGCSLSLPPLLCFPPPLGSCFVCCTDPCLFFPFWFFFLWVWCGLSISPSLFTLFLWPLSLSLLYLLSLFFVHMLDFVPFTTLVFISGHKAVMSFCDWCFYFSCLLWSG